MRYGFVGLGHLGGHLAQSLLRAGLPLTVHDRDRAAAAPISLPARSGLTARSFSPPAPRS